MTETFDAIIFDMDGLLVDSEVVWQRAEHDFITGRGHQYTDAVREAIIGLRLDEFMARLRAIFGFEESVQTLSAELLDLIMARIPVETQAQPGAKAIIDYVRSGNIPHAIASSSPMTVIDATLKSQGWDDLFEIRCSADDDARGKPAPDVYMRAAKTLGVDVTKCLALEDSPNGARAAVAAGMTCYAVPDKSHSKPEAFAEITPHVFDSLHDVLKVLRS